jgi:hypothetical protein
VIWTFSSKDKVPHYSSAIKSLALSVVVMAHIIIAMNFKKLEMNVRNGQNLVIH